MSENIKNNPEAWLLETKDISVRYLALRDLGEADMREFNIIKERAHKEGRPLKCWQR